MSYILFGEIVKQTGLVLEITPSLLALVLVFALAMCAGASLFIINKIQRADPADLY